MPKQNITLRFCFRADKDSEVSSRLLIFISYLRDILRACLARRLRKKILSRFHERAEGKLACSGVAIQLLGRNKAHYVSKALSVLNFSK